MPSLSKAKAKPVAAEINDELARLGQLTKNRAAGGDPRRPLKD